MSHGCPSALFRGSGSSTPAPRQRGERPGDRHAEPPPPGSRGAGPGGQPGRGVRGDRRGGQPGRGALRQQHDDHQRHAPQPPGGGGELPGPRRGAPVGVASASGEWTWRRWWAPARPKPTARGRPTTPSRWSNRPAGRRRRRVRDPPSPPPRPHWRGSSRDWATPSDGPGRRATAWRGSPPTGSRPSTWGPAPACASATPSPPAPWSSWPAAPTAAARCGRERAPPTFEDIDLHAFEQRLDHRLAWAHAASSSLPGATRCSCPPTPPPISWWPCPSPCRVGTPRRAAARSRRRGEAPRSANRCAHCPSSSRRPRRARAGVGALRGQRGIGDRRVGLRQRAAHRPTGWIEEGRLRRLQYHRAGAAHAGVEPSPPVGNLTWSFPAPPPASTT